jgi:hypothetical protein
MPDHAATNPASTIRQAVVLVPRGLDRPASLLRGLGQRRITVRVVEDAYDLLVALAQEQPQVVILHEPGRLPRLGELIATLTTYYPKVLCWRYADSDGSGLTKLALPPVVSATARTAAPAEETLLSREPLESPGRESAAAVDDGDEPLLNEDELTMLLAPFDDEPQNASKI